MDAGLRFAICDEEKNVLHSRQVADDFGKGPGNGGKFSGPVGDFVWPAEPGGFVRLLFGGHAEAERMRRIRLRSCFHGEKEFNTEVAEDTEKRREAKNPGYLSPSQRLRMG